MTMSTAAPAEHFHALYRQSTDPWHTADSWYEQRKLALVLAMLPQPRFSYVYEPGCGSGVTTLALAARCERLLASDFCDAAVSVAAQRLSQSPHVQVRKEILPEQWPGDTAPFELVVLSELCYYLDDAQLQAIVASCIASLEGGGYLLACHYTPDFDDRQQDTDTIHGLFARQQALSHCAHYEDPQFRVDLWQKQPAGWAP